jgi:hypothetical protein
MNDRPGAGSLGVRFDADALAGQAPPAAVRYLAHAIRPGAFLPRVAHVRFHGRLRLRPDRPWLAFRATETIVVNNSFEFQARAWLGPLPVTAQDRYAAGHGTSQVRLLGLLPIVSKHGADTDEVMRSRLVVESVWLPSAFVPANGAHWTQDSDAVRVAVPVHGELVHATLELGPAGELQAMRLDRWSDLTDDQTYGPIPFESRIEGERSFGDLTIPSELHATWWAGTDRAFRFFEAAVDDASFTA